VTITNRRQDFPDWFDLHPLEVKGSLCTWMQARIDANDYPDEPLDAPNIWRAQSGDRVLWLRSRRGPMTSTDGVLEILDCWDSVAVLGEHRDGAEAFMQFREPSHTLFREAIEAEERMEPARTFGSDWKLG